MKNTIAYLIFFLFLFLLSCNMNRKNPVEKSEKKEFDTPLEKLADNYVLVATNRERDSILIPHLKGALYFFM